MKKKIIISLSVIITMLLSISVYTYITNNKISSYIEESSSLRKKTLILSDLRSDLVKCSQDQRLYILTQDKDYKNKFNEGMKEIYQNVENMHKEGYLTLTEKNKLTYTLDNFKDLNINYFNQSYNSSISTQLENEIINYNTEQLKILNNITLDITSQSENIEKENDKINSLSALQSKSIQSASSLVAIIISGFLYYFKVKLKKDNVDIEDIINYLTTNDKENIDNDNNKKIDDLNLLKSKITENKVLLDNAKLLYMQSLKLKDQYEKSEVILDQIDSSTKSLKLILNTLENYPDTTQKIILNDIENQLLNLKILFKSLPYYNDFVMDISKNMIKNNKD